MTIEVNNNEVICPACSHQFRAIPINVQALLLAAGIEPPFTQLLQRQLEAAVNAERKRCIDICNAEDEKYWRILEERKETATWAGERGVGARDCARKIAGVANNP